MKKIDELTLKAVLEEKNNVTNKTIYITSNLEIYLNSNKKINFKDCIFEGNDIFFIGGLEKDKQIKNSIFFHNCTINVKQINFINCNIENMYFSKTIIKDTVRISDTKIGRLSFINNCKIELLDVYGTSINNRFSINNKNTINRLLLGNSVFSNEVTFFNSKFNIFDISNSNFKNDLNFNKNKVIGNIQIHKSNFNNLNFENNIFSSKDEHLLNIRQSSFNGKVYFSNIKAHYYNFTIKDCIFKKFVSFNNSIFNKLEILQTRFSDITSFQNTIFDDILIDRTNFEKIAYFDDIQINNIEKSDKRTIRNIKQELQKANNTIDYDIFRAYELNSHRKKLLKEKKYKDAFILYLGYLYSKNGMNWFRALLMTIFISFVFYSIFYWIETTGIKISKIEIRHYDKFLNGFTKYLIPTNIYNPLVEEKKFVTGLSWLPFIMGKIFLSIGIYETIRSFRKFKK